MRLAYQFQGQTVKGQGYRRRGYTTLLVLYYFCTWNKERDNKEMLAACKFYFGPILVLYKPFRSTSLVCTIIYMLYVNGTRSEYK